MKKRLIKEARALLPAFSLAVGLTFAASLLWRGETAVGGGVFIFAIGCTLVGANCFGHESTSQTMGLLLSQPMSRRRIWYEKMLVLGAAIALAFWAWVACFYVVTDTTSFTEDDVSPVLIVGVISVAVFCSAPWLALKTRNTLLASLSIWFWPLALYLCLALLGWLYFENYLESFFDRHSPGPYALAAVGIYCAAAYWRGYVALMKFQNAAARQREIALPDRWQDALARPLGKLLPRYTNPVSSLIRKEILLQRPAYVAAAALCVMALIGAVVDKIHDSDVDRGLLAALLVICVLILPLVATGLSVAEERNLGLASWHRTLPPSLRKQWLVKLTVVLGTCVFLGVVLPCLMGATGWAIGLFPDAHPTPTQPMEWPPFSNILLCCLAYLLLLTIGIFASSVSRTTFRAILLTLTLLAGITILSGVSISLASRVPRVLSWQSYPHPLPHYLSVLMFTGSVNIGLAIWLGVLGILAYANYRVPEPSPRRAWLHTGIVLATPAVLLTAFCMVLLLSLLL